MAMIVCKECSAPVSDQAKRCPACGFVLNKSKAMAYFGYSMAVVVGFIGLVLVAGELSPNASEKGRDRRAIEACKEQISSPSLSADSSRMVSRTCDSLVDQYRERWGTDP